MNKRRKANGFTMAEMLIVVAIIAVLAGVSFIAVAQYQRSMALLERDAVAKEIFVAAQNHLTMAESQGYLSTQSNIYGTQEKAEDRTAAGITIDPNRQYDNIYYFMVSGASNFTGNQVLDLMLPFGAIDETVRAGGSYIIRYQANPAVVLDVFYCPKSGNRYTHDISKDDYKTVLALGKAGTESSRKSYGSDKAVLGWYGGESTLKAGEYLETPSIELINEERLIVKVTDPNTDKMADATARLASLKLIITGESSKAQLAINLKETSDSARYSYRDKVYTVVLDDITTSQSEGIPTDGLHFAELNNYSDATTGDLQFLTDASGKKTFIPGEDITVQAVSYSNTALTNIAYSAEETANSLFADYEETTEKTAYIANFRHLENLDGAVSGVGTGTGTDAITITVAEQIVDLGKLPESEDGASDDETGDNSSGEGSGESGGGTNEEVELTDSGAGTTPAAEKDLSWTGFVAAIKAAKADNADVKVYALSDSTGTAAGCYYPISPGYALTYKGGYDVVEGTKNVHKAHIITNVSASGTGAAGLFGAPTQALTVSDLVLYDFEISGSDAGALAGTLPAGSSVTNVLAYHGETAKTVTGTGNAGGLVGSFTADSDATSTVTQSAAAMLVSSTGTGSGGSTSGSTGSSTSGSAGGLIGSAASVTVTDSYSGGHTADGKYNTDALTDYNVNAASGNAGGLIGAASGTTSVEYCYSTCSASGNVAGSLIGAASGDKIAVSNSYAVGKTSGNDALVGSGTLSGQTITDFDFVHGVDMDNEDLMMPEAKIAESDPAWKTRWDAAPYDSTLGIKYVFPTVSQLHQLKPQAQQNQQSQQNQQDQQTEPVHLSTHYGDWEEITLLADADLALINAERLSAKITLPKEQIADGGVITMLIRGETSHPIDLTSDAYNAAKDVLLVLKVTKTTDASNKTVYALSLSPVSVVPGVTAENLQTWFSKLKKAGVGVKVPALDDATQTNAEIELNLDDITAPGSHFAQLFTTFIPGENISVAVKGGVVASDKLNTLVTKVMNATENSVPETKTITTQAEDGTVTTTTVTRTVAARTNSLFADPKRGTMDGTDVSTATAASAAIANFRHLENLDNAISGVNAEAATLKYTTAVQIVDLSKNSLPDGTVKDLSWSGFMAAIIKGRSYENTAVTPSSTIQPDNTTQPDTTPPDTTPPVQVYQIGTSAVCSKANCFLPVNMTGLTTYNGGYTVIDSSNTSVQKAHSITGVKVDTTGYESGIYENAGLFGTLPSGCMVSNLELIDFNIKGTTTAGALAGESSATITNVLVHNTTKTDDSTGNNVGDVMTPTVTATGSAGGLVGYMTGGKVEQSAAALVVSSTGGSAGGLIGTVTGGTVTGSYSGGHTSNGAYDDGHFNVIATGTAGNAGGLIGTASGSVTVDYCYSTCSATGTAAGSLIGAANGNSITVSKSYAVGKTSGTTSGSVQTFLGSGSLAGRTGADYDFVYAVDMDNDDLLIPADMGPSDPDWKERADAVPYDSTLGTEYIYPTVKQLYQMAGATLTGTQSAQFTTHYGDWGPIPQLYVNLELINRERLSAKITLPATQIADGGKLTLLIHGDSTNKDAYLVFKVTTTKGTDGKVTAFTLALSPESTVPGVEAADLDTTWFDAGIGTTTAESVDTVEIKLNLDDITAVGKHFTNLFPQFTPGENITAAVKGGVIAQTKLNAIVSDTTEASWMVKDSDNKDHMIAARTNSLFADPKTTAYPDGTDLSASTGACVSIANFRHLENLDATISNLASSLSITKAVQIADLSDKAATDTEPEELLSWTGFGSTIVNGETDSTGNVKKIKVYKYSETTEGTADGYFLPVNPAAIEYDGQGHSITGVVVNTAGEAGLFGALISGSTVKNLELIDFDITATSGNAGALAGTLNSVTVENILVHDSGEDGKTTAVASNSGSAGGLIGTMTDSSVTNALVYGSSATVNATGSAGGLIGSMSGASTKVKYCAAALVVNSSGGDAGGLIGAATGGEVSGSYSGGHTTNGEYTAFNVTAAGSAGNAGGLIGDASGVTKVENCYSTCSATGSTAGGLVGTASGTFTNCYATGLVQGTTESAKVGAFAGSFSGSTDAKKPCLYFEAVNSGMAAIGDNTTGVTIRELDENLIKYKEFVGTTWTDAKPYDEKLKTDYEDKVNNGKYLYNLKGMTRLDASTPATNFVATHYGDWPMPGILVNNTKNGG